MLFILIIVMELLVVVLKVEISIINRILFFVLYSFEGGIIEDYWVCVYGECDKFFFVKFYCIYLVFYFMIICSGVKFVFFFGFFVCVLYY